MGCGAGAICSLRERAWGMAIHRVRFQPVGIEIEVNEDETVLNAAFRQGVSLTHGCREGQCSACKSFLLDGDIEMEKYSTFALPEYESEEGYVLLCRCHAYSDLEVELINYDEDITSPRYSHRDLPNQRLRQSNRSPMTSNVSYSSSLSRAEMLFTAGQNASIAFLE